MRKFAFVILTFAFIFAGCSSDDDKGQSCEQLGQKIADAFEAYVDDPSDENEQALDAAYTAYENAGCDTGED